MTQEINKEKFNSFIKEGLVLIDFYADWCGPCVVMGPIVDEVAEKFDGKIKFGKVDIDDNIELARKYETRSIPNFILFKDGEIAENFIGSMSKEEFVKKLKKHV